MLRAYSTYPNELFFLWRKRRIEHDATWNDHIVGFVGTLEYFILKSRKDRTTTTTTSTNRVLSHIIVLYMTKNSIENKKTVIWPWSWWWWISSFLVVIFSRLCWSSARINTFRGKKSSQQAKEEAYPYFIPLLGICPLNNEQVKHFLRDEYLLVLLITLFPFFPNSPFNFCKWCYIPFSIILSV